MRPTRLAVLVLVLACAAARPALAQQAAERPAPAGARPPAASTPPAPKPTSLKEAIAAVAAGTAAGELRIAVKPTIAYDPARQALRTRVPLDLETETLGDGPQRTVTVYRLTPTRRDALPVIETTVPFGESKQVSDDLDLVVTGRPAKPGAEAVRRAKAKHAPTKAQPWEGTLETVELLVEVSDVKLVRRSSGAVMPPVAAVQPQGETANRRFLDNQGRAGFRWSMRHQDEYLEVCRSSLKGQDSNLSIERRCKCMLMQMQVSYPKRPPPGGIDPKRDREMRRVCSPQ
ncbi:MAG: hypothetical protein U0229_24035 [Anaeromyxobacter sp.]